MVFHLKKLESPLTQECLVPRLVEIGSVVLEKKIFQIPRYFHYFIIISPWKRVGPFIWNKFEFPSSKNDLCQVWLNLAKWYFKICPCIFFLPLEKTGPSILTNLNPLHSKMICAKFGWNWLCGSGEEDKNVKSLQQRWRRTTDKLWSEKLTWAFGSGELKKQKI